MIQAARTSIKRRILLIEDDETFFDALGIILEGLPLEIVWAKSGSEGIQLFQQGPQEFAVVVIDYLLPNGVNGGDICRHLKRINREQLFLFTSKHFEKEFLLDQLRVGSDGFVDKTSGPEAIRSEVSRAIALYEQEARVLGVDDLEKSKIQRELESEGMIGRSSAMFKMLGELRAARNSKYSTLIVGATGSGKELVARSLVPKAKSLVAVNCASFINRENMLESELFGYVKGAFTDAKSDTPGLVVQAAGQVLFLDELHQLPLAAQAKLLRFLQEMKFRRVGDSSGREIAVDFKLVAAVQPDIRERLRDGRFLPDLLERVGALVVKVPDLNERLEDIEILVQKFQDEFNESKPVSERKQVRISTITEMQKHPWPTNVRGLQNAVKRMLTNCASDIVNPRDFTMYLKGSLLTEPPSTHVLIVQLGEATRELEIQSIRNALTKSRTRVEAAARLGLPFTSFLRRLVKFQIDANQYLQTSHKEKVV